MGVYCLLNNIIIELIFYHVEVNKLFIGNICIQKINAMQVFHVIIELKYNYLVYYSPNFNIVLDIMFKQFIGDSII